MQYRHLKGPLQEIKSDLLAVGVFGDPTRDTVFKAINKATEGLLKTVAREQCFAGKASQSVVVRSESMLPAKHLAVLGLGEKSAFVPPSIRDFAARTVAIGQRLGAHNVALTLPPLALSRRADGVQYAVEGAVMGSYRFNKYRTQEEPKNTIKRFGVISSAADGKLTAAQSRAINAALARGEAVAEAVCRARDFVNEPAGYMTPSRIAEEAKNLAKKHNLKIKVLGRRECERLGMGMFLAVAQGSIEEPKLIHLTYSPPGKPASKVALIGKGVMFDSGGYSLKPSSAMEDMKMDMAGAAVVLASMSAIATLGSKHEVHAIAACCENLISGSAFKLRDILTAMDGTTVEINNTDAEGRLTLGDAIIYARTKVKPDQILDFATLTGACVIALGPYTAGVMSHSEDMVKRWFDAAERTGEDMWRLPLTERLKPQLKSHLADMRNTGERWGGALTAGLFLQHFAGDSPWLHVDLAGPAMAARNHGAVQRGGTGFAVATIVEYLARD
ncbi:MAG: leucyl aminopeptidase [Proteobacteria bacterium]|nr:leucyl aminopeptidase [Pseudomonadota bacterium]